MRPLGLAAPPSATDADIQKNFGSSMTLIISNKEMDDIIKVIKSLEESILYINNLFIYFITK